MGNVCVNGAAAASDPYVEKDYGHSASSGRSSGSSRSSQHANSRDSTGHRLGGDDGALAGLSAREAAALAAQARADAQKPEADKRRKDELIGKISAAYARRGEVVPIGLPMLPLERLVALWQDLRDGGGGGRSSTARGSTNSSSRSS